MNLVTCQDCESWDEQGDGKGLCNLTSSYNQPSWVEMFVPGPSLLITDRYFFCKHGHSKEGDDNDEICENL